MCKQYNYNDAADFIYNKIAADNYTRLTEEQLKSFIRDCAEEEENYMKEAGFFSEPEDTGRELIYDEEDAYNYILSKLSRKAPYAKWNDNLLEDLIDDYIEYNYDYMVSIDLIE